MYQFYVPFALVGLWPSIVDALPQPLKSKSSLLPAPIYARNGSSPTAENMSNAGLSTDWLDPNNLADNPTAERNRICVKYNEASPENVQDVIQWFNKWLEKGDGRYPPHALQDDFGIPQDAFDCPGPFMLRGTSKACVVPTEEHCFTGLGSKEDLTMAWEVLNLIARYRVSQHIVEGMYAYALMPPEGDQYGKGLARDFASILKDFYNGAYGDSALPASDMLDVVASLFLFSPYGISNSKTLYNANLDGLQRASSMALQCNFGDLMNGTDCLLKPGFGGVIVQFMSRQRDIDRDLDYRDVISDMANLIVPLYPEGPKLWEQYRIYREYFQRAMFILIQKQQSLFIHVQPYDLQPAPGKEDDYDAYRGVFCSAIVSSKPGSWCRDNVGNSTDNRAYYPVQITLVNGTVSFDYAAWATISDYGWDSHTILDQSHRCANLNGQNFDLSGAYPHIFSAIRDRDNALAFYNGLKKDDIDFADCLWSLPILDFSDGPHYEGSDKSVDTALHRVGALGSLPGQHVLTPREQWKDDQPRSQRLREVVRDSNYCPILGVSTETGTTGILSPFLKTALGWGETESDDQVVADVYGAQQLVDPSSPASSAISQIKDAACDKQKKDSYAKITKTLGDLLINVAVFWVTSGGSCLIALATQSTFAAVGQTLADDFWLQPWLDSVLKKQFRFPGNEQAKAGDNLDAKQNTAKPSDEANDKNGAHILARSESSDKPYGPEGDPLQQWGCKVQ